MRTRTRTLLPLVAAFALLLAGCARKRPMYDYDMLEPANSPELPSADPIYSVYFTGSAGGIEEVGDSPTLGLLERVLAKADTQSAVLFLGDNGPGTGMPEDEDEGDRQEAERTIDAQLAVVEGYPGEVVFLHGDKDWEEYDLSGAEEMEDYIEDAYGAEIMLPENACGDPVLLEVNPHLGILVINSQWFLSDWSEYQEVNEGCLSQTRKEMGWRLKQLIKDVAYDHVVVAMHHPLISRGPRGGEHNFASLFQGARFGPLSSYWRTKIGVQNDLYSPRMEELRGLLKGAFDEHPGVTFVSGHEYLLQYGTFRDHPVVGSGTAYEQDPGRVGQRTIFTAGVPGIAELHYYENGEAWLRIREADGSPEGKTIFRRRLYELPQPTYEGDFELYESGVDSFTFAPFADYREFGPLYEWLIGTNNRVLFETPYTYPVLRLDEWLGGVKVTKRGGGGQTNSLRLTDSLGRDYALRSVRKDPLRLLPAQARVGPLITLTRDVFFSANPFAALAAADLAGAVGIPHANPKLVYLPPQPELGEYPEFGDLNASHGGDLYLLEERPNDEWIGSVSPLSGEMPFGEPLDIEGRDDVFEDIRESGDHQLDQRQYLKARLLDLLVGDFDRHSDQWRFTEYKDSFDVSRWQVIPRDRDQAMIRAEGAGLRLAGKTLPAARQAQSFTGEQPYVTDFAYQARMLDRRFLNELTREDWLAVAGELQADLTDAEIEASFADWPAAAQRDSRAAELVAAVKQRRDDLGAYARELYAFQAESVYVVGTDDDDFFDVVRRPDGSVEVSVYNFDHDEDEPRDRDDRFYHRVFHPGETKDIQLFGMREEDRFEVTGESENRSIKIRIVPGPEVDEVVTEDKVPGLRRRTRVYAWPDEDELDLGSEAEAHLTRYTRFNRYDYRAVEYDYGIWLPDAGFNVDDGVRLGLSYQRHHYTYHRHFTQRLGALFATASQGLRVDYDASVIDVAPYLDLGLKLAYQTPSFATNFFGLGNETFEGDVDRDRYRIRQELYGAYPSLTIRNKVHDGGLTLGLGFEGVQLERNPKRLFGEAVLDYPADDPLFDLHTYGGVGVQYTFLNSDVPSYMRDGMRFTVGGLYRRRFDPEPTDIFSANAALTVYQHLWRGAALVSRVGGGIVRGDYYFYNGQSLGAGTLRGYRRERFIGDESFYHNTDLRQQFRGRLVKSRMGVFASFDHGRVWYDGGVEVPESDVWHYSYGGGVFVRPLSLFTLSAGYYVPEDDSNAVVRVRAGFDF